MHTIHNTFNNIKWQSFFFVRQHIDKGRNRKKYITKEDEMTNEIYERTIQHLEIMSVLAIGRNFHSKSCAMKMLKLQTYFIQQ